MASKVSEYGRRNGDSVMRKIVDLWPVILAVVTLIYGAAMIQGKVADHEVRITKLETGMGAIQSDTDRLVEELINKPHHRRQNNEN